MKTNLDRFSGLPLDVTYIDGRNWRMHHDLAYRTAAGEEVLVRAGFVTDFASIPRLFWRLVPPTGDTGNPYGLAAVPHDWLYVHRRIGGRVITRAEADAIFHEILLYVGTHRWLAGAMYRAVRAFGWVVWNRRTNSPQPPKGPMPMNTKNALPAVAVALILAAGIARAGEIVEPEIAVRDGGLCAGLRVNLHELVAPEARIAEGRALLEAALHPTPGNIAALAALRGEQAHAGQVRQVALVERAYDLGMAPGCLYADAAPAGAIADPVAVQTVATTNYANRGMGERIGDHFSRNSGRYGLAAAAGLAGYGVYKVGDNQGWWGKKETKTAAAKPKPLPTQAATTGGGASIQINGDGNTVNFNNGGEGNVTGGGTGQVTQPAVETPAVETPTPAT